MLHQIFTLGGLSGQVRLAKAVELRAGWRASGNIVNPLDESGSRRLCIRSSYAGAVRENPNSDAIDVVADVKTERVLLHDLSIFFSPFMIKIHLQLSQFQQLDVIHFFFPTDCSYRRQRLCWLCNLQGCSFKGYRSHKSEQTDRTLFSVLVGKQFHSLETSAMLIIIFHAQGIPKFILISVHDYNLPSFLLQSGYFKGKRRAESEVLSKFPSSAPCLQQFDNKKKERIFKHGQIPALLGLLRSGVSSPGKYLKAYKNLKLWIKAMRYMTCFQLLLIVDHELLTKSVVLRPAFIYGKRKVNGVEIPLDLIGEPVEKLLRATESFIKPLNSLPASDLVLAPPVSVDDVAYAVINAIKDDDCFGIFTIEQIKEAAAGVKV
ncbi:hypothetical protein BC332_00874 [Capsicum chinense]|nr:hypothetical protein BC332_00874 [Capsicum chinense]